MYIYIYIYIGKGKLSLAGMLAGAMKAAAP